MHLYRRGFKPLFSLIVALGLGTLGLFFGLTINSYFSAHKTVPAWLDPLKTMQTQMPGYMNFLTFALCALGVLSGSILGNYSGQKLVEAGNTLEKMSARDKIAVILGALIGAFISVPFWLIFFRLGIAGFTLAALLSVASLYLGIRALWGMKEDIPLGNRAKNSKEAEQEGEEVSTIGCKILDTNVIIDGRIADVSKTGFLEGILYVPGFVLDELQHIADSADGLKRARGRRGLDILNIMQQDLPLKVRVWDKALERAAQHDEVDTKLVKLARALGGMIVTNDYNLNKVAALQGVQVLNVNELANAIKPVVMVGESMVVGIVKEGKEADQGVAYLDDGTMIVVEDGRRYLNSTRSVVVTSVLQTVAGKMIFARTRSEEEGDTIEEHGANHSTPGGFAGNVSRRSDSARSRAGKKI